MKTISLFLIVLGFLATAASAAEVAVPTLSEKYRDARFHYHKTQNFEIVSIDPAVPHQVEEYAEELKTWVAERWGLHDIGFTKPCMLVCFPSQEMFKDCLKVDYKEPKISIAKGLDGQDREVITIWVVADPQGQWLRTALPEKIGRAVMINYEQAYGLKLPVWVHLGTSFLNNDLAYVRTNLSGLNPSTNYDVNDLFNLTAEEFAKKSAQDNHSIKLRAACCCLLIRKELGEKAFTNLLSAASKGDSAAGVKSMGYNSTIQFSQSFNSFCRNLAYDLRSNRTPKLYLTWFVR